MIYDITSTLSLEKRIKAIPWPRRTPHILPLVKTEMNLFFLVKQQIFKNIWRWLQPVAVADAGPINGDSVSFTENVGYHWLNIHCYRLFLGREVLHGHHEE